jgi:hypothetical protein
MVPDWHTAHSPGGPVGGLSDHLLVNLYNSRRTYIPFKWWSCRHSAQPCSRAAYTLACDDWLVSFWWLTHQPITLRWLTPQLVMIDSSTCGGWLISHHLVMIDSSACDDGLVSIWWLTHQPSPCDDWLVSFWWLTHQPSPCDDWLVSLWWLTHRHLVVDSSPCACWLVSLWWSTHSLW